MAPRYTRAGTHRTGIAAASVLPREFYGRDTVQVARELLGTLLVRRSRQGTTSGRIVEVEAYLHENDSACHAERGCTPSNRAMFGPPGRAYVYPIHSRYCLNAVTMRQDVATAVLIRAVEPVEGIELMRHRRRREPVSELVRGPAKLCEAFAIDRRLDRWDLTCGKRLWISDWPGGPRPGEHIAESARIGVTSAQDLPLRYFLKGNPFVSGPRRARSREQWTIDL